MSNNMSVRGKTIKCLMDLNKLIRINYIMNSTRNLSYLKYRINNKNFMPISNISPYESIGPWPEIILDGVKCRRYLYGLCLPCSYSIDGVLPSFSEKINDQYKIIQEYILKQAKNIFFNKIDNILKSQIHPFKGTIIITLTTLGSILDPYEMHPKTLSAIIDMIKDSLLSINSRRIILILESHIYDIINKRNIDLLEHYGVIKKLHKYNIKTIIAYGLENINDTIRNIAYLKLVNKSSIDKANNIIRDLGFTPAAFVFVGHPGVTFSEELRHFEDTVKYLSNNDIIPILMYSNVKEGSFIKHLYDLNLYKPPDPWFILSTLNILVKYIYKKPKDIPFSYSIAWPSEGPPKPIAHPLAQSHICDYHYKIFKNIFEKFYLLKVDNSIIKKLKTIIKDYESDSCYCATEHKNSLRSYDENLMKKGQNIIERLLKLCLEVRGKIESASI